MTIKEMADGYIGYPKEIDESISTTMARKAYEKGARDMLNRAYSWLFENGLPELTGLVEFRKAMEG